ncbi:hypothetical protein [Carboxylicivirga linearis]|uniref:PH domain-containing protein n=1 Tax=Carboxylicivirga linearis TaxID=1628157 RepID=A0ABS5JQH2_9BACT|nr:hypothetical protein [Carboxylicivirga linearis]MBS2096721.1 hypothetical protein [Carboxylicivirga linearis]
MYRSVQIGWTIIFILLTLMTILGFTIPQNSLWLVGAISVIILLLFFRLTITIDNNWVKFSMGIGLINGKFPIKDILDCKAVDYIPLGWGIRFRPGKIIYNVSGNKAVELTVRGKNMKVWIGTADPETLVRIIREIKRKQAS